MLDSLAFTAMAGGTASCVFFGVLVWVFDDLTGLVYFFATLGLYLFLLSIAAFRKVNTWQPKWRTC